MLAFLEEDNIQRAYFRVHPLLTVEGLAREEAKRLWPNEGCLRIVPDRAEQHTFKERMRQLGGWCAVDLTAFAPEANKIRTNKNYHPERGEINQFILYSDAVHPLPEKIFYEVLDGSPEAFADLAKSAVTPLYYIREENTLYGPVSRQATQKPETAQSAEAMLYELDCPDGKTRQILCVASEAPHRMEAEKPAPAALDSAAKRDSAMETETADEAEETLPIGESLQILDESQTFEETLSGLNQPVSAGANLLRQTLSPAPAAGAPTPKLSGTPLYRAPVRTAMPQPKNRLQEVVYNQCRVIRNDPPAASLPAGVAMRQVSNPVENACSALRSAWAMPEAQNQLVNCILSLEGMIAKLEPKAMKAAGDSKLQNVMQARLQDLEAERLTLLVQLDKAREDLEAFRKSSVEEARSKARAELDALLTQQEALTRGVEKAKEQLNTLLMEREELAKRVEELQSEALPATLMERLSQCGVVAPLRGRPLRLSPVCGKRVAVEELFRRLEAQCKESGVPFEHNRAVAMLALLAICPRIGLAVQAQAAVVTLAQNFAGALGWQSGLGVQVDEQQKPLLSVCPADGTPALLLTGLPGAAPQEGVCVLLMTDSAEKTAQSPAYRMGQWPIVPFPALGFVPKAQTKGEPVAAESLKALLSVEPPMDTKAVDQVLEALFALVPPLGGEAREELYRFVACCARWMEGGLPAACDWAILLWILPALARDEEKKAAASPLLTEYPLSLAAL